MDETSTCSVCGNPCCPPIPPIYVGGPTFCCCADCDGSSSCGEQGDGSCSAPDCESCSQVKEPSALLTTTSDCDDTVYYDSCDGACLPQPCPPDSSPDSGGDSGGSCSGGCSGGCSCQGSSPSSGSCGCPDSSSPPSGTSAPGLSMASSAIGAASAGTKPAVPGTEKCSPSVNPANGNLVLTLAPPKGSPFDPPLRFTYNSRAAGSAIQFGSGIADLYNPTVTMVDSTTADLVDGAGSAYEYTDKDGGGHYLPPAGCYNALVQNSNDSWTETRPDGLSLGYDPTGALSKMVSPSGSIWTILRNSGNLLSAIKTPLNTRTTYAYTGSSLLRHTQDPQGRITTFTINPTTSDLKRVTWPDLSITSLAYDSSHRLTVYTSPDAARTTYAYDILGRVVALRRPSGARYTFAYGAGLAATDPAGNRTSVISDYNENTIAIVNTLGQRTSYVWSAGQRVANIDALGRRTSFAYVTLANRRQGLQSITNALGARYTFLYDGSSRTQTLIDYRGLRTTLVWDSSSRRIA